MIITSLHVDQFGVWRGLELNDVSEHLNVFYGPNEAGKTTLLNFIRSVLYGYSAQRRKQYISVKEKTRCGGRLNVTAANEIFRICRHAEAAENGQLREELHVYDAQGKSHADALLATLVGNIDEAIFNNIFAVGLDELQELSSLKGTQAADQLFKLSAGLDRVSIVEVMEGVASSRQRLVGPTGASSQAAALRSERQRLLAEMENLQDANVRYASAVRSAERLDREIAETTEDKKHLEERVRVLELAVSLRGRWISRRDALAELTALGDVPRLPEQAVEKYERRGERLRRAQETLAQLRREGKGLRKSLADLPINAALEKHSPRIEILGEQRHWLAGVAEQIETVQEEAAKIQDELNEVRHALGTAESIAASFKDIKRALGLLKPLAAEMREKKQRLREAREEIARREKTVQELRTQLTAALRSRSEADLTVAMEKQGSLVSQLRRLLQVEERSEQMKKLEKDLLEQNCQLLDRQLLPTKTLAIIGAPFVVGVALTLAGLFLPESIIGEKGLWLAGVGLIGTLVGVGIKFFSERAAAAQLAACEKQLETAAEQMQRLREEKEDIEKSVPRGGGPIPARLQNAEKELTALEELLPLDARRIGADREAEEIRETARRLKKGCRGIRHQWREELARLGLPVGWSINEVRQFARHYRRRESLLRHLAHREKALQEHRQSWELFRDRLDRTFQEIGVPAESAQPHHRLEQLLALVKEHAESVARRDELQAELETCRVNYRRTQKEVRREERGRNKLLRRCGAKDDGTLRELARKREKIVALQEDYENLNQQIVSALGTWCSEEELTRWQETFAVEELTSRWEEAAGRLPAVERQINDLCKARGSLDQELKSILADDRLERKKLELGTIDARLRETLERWQVLAVTDNILQSLRSVYERERQPETLKEASLYLGRLTEGRYVRVWTPLSSNMLLVDDAAGESLPVESLSRGTREQLFLSIRLALGAAYSRRGISLPLVLDDVLVNFDVARAKAAAIVLKEFAAQGNQVFVFTCHEHISKLFKSLKAAVLTLPGNADKEHVAVAPVHLPIRKSEPVRIGNFPAAVMDEQGGSEMLVITPDDAEEEADNPPRVQLHRPADDPLIDDLGEEADAATAVTEDEASLDEATVEIPWDDETALINEKLLMAGTVTSVEPADAEYWEEGSDDDLAEHHVA